MTREEAIRLMAIYEAMTSTLNPVFRIKLADAAESEAVNLAHGELIMTIYEKGMRRIIREYPDLDPDLDISGKP